MKNLRWLCWLADPAAVLPLCSSVLITFLRINYLILIFDQEREYEMSRYWACNIYVIFVQFWWSWMNTPTFRTLNHYCLYIYTVSPVYFVFFTCCNQSCKSCLKKFVLKRCESWLSCWESVFISSKTQNVKLNVVKLYFKNKATNGSYHLDKDENTDKSQPCIVNCLIKMVTAS